MRRVLHRGHAVGGVLQVAPGASRTVVQIGGDVGQCVAESFRRSLSTAASEDLSQIVRQTLVYPEQVGLHGFFVVRSREISGTPVFSVPRMHVFVRQQSRTQEALPGIDQGTLFGRLSLDS